MPSETRPERWLENRGVPCPMEGIVNVKTIDPGRDIGPGMNTRVSYAGARSSRTGQLSSRFR